MEKQIIFFDLDKTLLNGDFLKGDLFVPRLVAKCGLSKKEVSELFVAYQYTLEKNTDFDPQGLADYITKHSTNHSDQTNVLSVLYEPKSFAQAIFSEVKPILSELQKNFILGIFSEGVEFWQRKKLDNMGIKHYFEQNLVIVERRKTAITVLEKLPEGAVVVDDNVEVIKDLLKFGKVTPVWINRTDKPPLEGVVQISSLIELPVLLERLNLK